MTNLSLIEPKNIWVAASDGDLNRVKELVESGISPMVPDENTYTPLHAAASWGRLEVLRYLCSKGGNLNITDEDGDTPLFSVEDLETAKLVIELGGDPLHTNLGGLTAAESLSEDYPEITTYLRELTGQATLEQPAHSSDSPQVPVGPDPTGEMTLNLLDRVRDVMVEADRNGISPDSAEIDDRLRQIVSQTVDQSVGLGRRLASGVDIVPPSIGANHLEMVLEGEEAEELHGDPEEPESHKRQRI